MCRSYFLKSFPQGDNSARQRGLKSEYCLSQVSCQRLSSLTCPFAGNTTGNTVQASIRRLRPCRRPHHSYRPSVGLPRGDPRTRHRWKLSGAKVVENGGVRADPNASVMKCKVTPHTAQNTTGVKEKTYSCITFSNTYPVRLRHYVWIPEANFAVDTGRCCK